MKPRGVTIVVHIDGDPSTKKYHLPLWWFEAGKWSAVTVALLVVLFFAFAEPLTHAAARVPGLEREVARLRQENGRVQELAGALSRAEANYQELRQLLGARAGGEPAAQKPEADMMRAVALRASVPAAAPVPPSTSTPAPTPAPPPPPPPVPAPAPAATRALSPPRKGPESSTSLRWPLDAGGFVTRGEVKPGDPAESHSGIDIAVPLGTPVRAAGGAVVEKAGTDSAYGLFVLLQHPGHYETLYGHASRLLVREGDSVQVGQVIALSGSSGHSTAPHLHFEIRLDGKPVDPLTLVKREN
jgi:murein DD-endopeptidase MepM/ murein hydrolase activator NlpD